MFNRKTERRLKYLEIQAEGFVAVNRELFKRIKQLECKHPKGAQELSQGPEKRGYSISCGDTTISNMDFFTVYTATCALCGKRTEISKEEYDKRVLTEAKREVKKASDKVKALTPAKKK